MAAKAAETVVVGAAAEDAVMAAVAAVIAAVATVVAEAAASAVAPASGAMANTAVTMVAVMMGGTAVACRRAGHDPR